MPRCNAIKGDLQLCNHWVHQVGDLCGTHIRSHTRRLELGGPQQEGKCCMFLTTNRWCQHDAVDGERLCAHHVQARGRREEIIANRNRMREIALDAYNRHPRPTWQAFIDEIIAQDIPADSKYAITVRYFQLVANIPIRNFRNRYDWALYGRVGPEPVPLDVEQRPRQQELARLAADSQNVHTTAVSNQTNAGMDKLLHVEVSPKQRTEFEINQGWLISSRPVPFNQYLRVANDMNKWFLMNTCRKENDNLYRRLLRGLVATINGKDEDLRRELYKRLWEECSEAVGLCCEGHLSRLCNVMVGFDDDFQTEISMGEAMQNEMARIAGQDLPVEERLSLARSWFAEHAVPEADRLGWLAAIEAM
jgi:hypothetical protein